MRACTFRFFIYRSMRTCKLIYSSQLKSQNLFKKILISIVLKGIVWVLCNRNRTFLLFGFCHIFLRFRKLKTLGLYKFYIHVNYTITIIHTYLLGQNHKYSVKLCPMFIIVFFVQSHDYYL